MKPKTVLLLARIDRLSQEGYSPRQIAKMENRAYSYISALHRRTKRIKLKYKTLDNFILHWRTGRKDVAQLDESKL